MGTSITPLNPLAPRRAGRRSPWGGGSAGVSGEDDQAKSPNTFAGMQQRGMARPAPPAGSSYYGPSGGPAGSGVGAPPPGPAPASAPAYTPPQTGVRPQLTAAVGQLLAQPSGYQSDQVTRDYGVLNQQLGIDATEGKRAIDEEMARRGLHASTFTGDKYGQLQAKQDLARSQFGANFLDNEAKDMATARSNAIASALGFEQMSGDEGLATFGANQAAQNQNFTQGMSRAQLSSSNANAAADRALQENLQGNQLGFGREQLQATTHSADLDRALQAQLGLGSQDVQRLQIASNQQISTADREQRAKDSAAQLGLDYAKLSEDDKQYLGNLDLGKQNLAATNTNAAAERALQDKLATNQLGFSREQLASQNANAKADREQQAKLAADQLGLDYTKLSQQDKDFLIEQSGMIGDQKTLGAQSLDVQKDLAKAQLAQQENDFNLRIIQLLASLGFPADKTQALIDAAKKGGKGGAAAPLGGGGGDGDGGDTKGFGNVGTTGGYFG